MVLEDRERAHSNDFKRCENSKLDISSKMEEEEINEGKITYYDWKNSNEENDEWRQEIEKNGEAKYSFHSAELLEKMDQLGHTPPLPFYVNQNACYENGSFEDTDNGSDSRVTDNSNDVISIHFLETIFEETDDDIEEVDSESSEPSYGYGCFDNDDTGSVIYIPISIIEDNKISKEGLSSPNQVAKPQRRKSGQQIWSTSKEPAGDDSLLALDDINLQVSGNDSRLVLSGGKEGNEKLIKVDNKVECFTTSPLSIKDNCKGKEASMQAEPETSRYKDDTRSTVNASAQLFCSSFCDETAEDLCNECNRNYSDQSQNYDKIWIRNDLTVKAMTMEAVLSDLPKTTGIYENYKFREKSTEDDGSMVIEGNEADLENNIYDKIWIDNSEIGIPGQLGALQNEEVLITSKYGNMECTVDINANANKGIPQHTNNETSTDLEDICMPFADNIQKQNCEDNWIQADGSIVSELIEGPNSTFTCDTYESYEGIEPQEMESLKIDAQNLCVSSSAFMSNFDSILENACVEYSEFEYLNKGENIPEADEQHQLNPCLEHEDGTVMYCSDMDVSSCDESDDEDINLTLKNSRCRVRSFASFDDLSTIGIEGEEEDITKNRLSYSTMLTIVSEGTETEDDDKSSTVTNQLAPAEKCASLGQDYETAKLPLLSVNVVLTEHNVNEVRTEFKTENRILLPNSEPNLLCLGSKCPSNIGRTYPCRSMPSLAEFKFYDGNPKEKPLTRMLPHAPKSPLPISELNPEEPIPVFKYNPSLLEAGDDKCVLTSSETASSFSEDKQFSMNPEFVKINNYIDEPLEINVIYNDDSLHELPALSKSRLKVTDNEEELDLESRLAKDSEPFPESEKINKMYDFCLMCNQDHLNCTSSLLDSQLERCGDLSPNEIPCTNVMLRSLILPDYEHTTSDNSNKFVRVLPQNVSDWVIETDRPHVLLTTVNHPNPDFEEEAHRMGTMPFINEETVSENLCSNQLQINGSKLDITTDVCRDFADEENEIDIRQIKSWDLVTDIPKSNLLQNVIEKVEDELINDTLVPNRKSKVQEKFLDDIKDPTKNHLNGRDEQIIRVDQSGKTMSTPTEETMECNSELSKSLESPFKIPTKKRNQSKGSFTKKHQNLTYYTKKYELLEVDLLDGVFETSSLSVNQPLTEKDLAEIGLTGEAATKGSNLTSSAIITPLNVVSSQLYNELDAEEPTEIGSSRNGRVSPKHDSTLRNLPIIEQSVSSEQSSPVDCPQLPPVVNAMNIYHSDKGTVLDDKKRVKKDVVKDTKSGYFNFTEITEVCERPNSPGNTSFNLNVSTSPKSKAQKSKSTNKINPSQKGFFERFSVGRLSKKDVLRKGKSLSDNDINKIKPVTYDKPEKPKFSFFNFGRHKKHNTTESQKSESPDSKLTSKTCKNSLFYTNIHSRDVVDFSKTKSLSSLSVDAVDIYKSESFNVLRNITETISILKETPINMGKIDRLYSNDLSLKKMLDDQPKEDLAEDTASSSYTKRNLVHSFGNDQIDSTVSKESYLVSNSLLEDIYTPHNINGTINTLSEYKDKSRQIMEHQKLNLSPSDNEECFHNSELEMKVIPTNTTSGKFLQSPSPESPNCSSNSRLILSLIEGSDETDEKNQKEVKIPSEVRIMSKNPNDEAKCSVNIAKDRYHETKNQAETQQEEFRSLSPCPKEPFSRVEGQQERIFFPDTKNETLKHQKNHFSDTKDQNTNERVNYRGKEHKSFAETKEEILNNQQIVFHNGKERTYDETARRKNPRNFLLKEEHSYPKTNIETLDHQSELLLSQELYPLDNYSAYGYNAFANTSQDNLHLVKNNLSVFDVQQVKETKRNCDDSHSLGSSRLKEQASSSNRAFLETNLDENIGTCRNFHHHSYDVKAKSMLNLDGFSELPNPRKLSDQVELRAMSVEHLLDESRKNNLEAPENELQRTSNQQPSEYEIKVQKSLQKLNIPEWYKPNKFRIISPKSKSHPRWSNPQQCQASLEKNNWQNVKRSRDTSSLSSTTSDFSCSNTGSNFLLDPKCVRFGSSRSIQSRSSNFSSERDDLYLMSLSSPSYCSERSTPLGRNFLSVHKPYLGWRSRESLSAQNGYKTPAERLAESFQSNSHVDLQKSDVKTSIHELTSAIQDYVHSDPLNHHDKVNKNSPRKPKMWLESSFLGLSTLDLQEQDNIRDFIPKPSEEILLI